MGHALENEKDSPRLIRLLLADDNPAMLETLVDVLGADFAIVGTLLNGASVLADVSSLEPDVILLDVSLGDMTGFQVAKRLRLRGCSAKIVFVSVHENVEFVRAAFDIGASGYVFKSQIARDLANAIRIAADGGHFFTIANV
jgi:DNA-binding NarL/FixJ family response regulator